MCKIRQRREDIKLLIRNGKYKTVDLALMLGVHRVTISNDLSAIGGYTNNLQGELIEVGTENDQEAIMKQTKKQWEVDQCNWKEEEKRWSLEGKIILSTQAKILTLEEITEMVNKVNDMYRTPEQVEAFGNAAGFTFEVVVAA